MGIDIRSAYLLEFFSASRGGKRNDDFSLESVDYLRVSVNNARIPKFTFRRTIDVSVDGSTDRCMCALLLPSV